MSWMNLDLKAAETASALAKIAENSVLKKNDVEKIVQTAGSVLAHQGLSAYFLHLKATKKPWARDVESHTYELLRTAWPEVLAVVPKGNPLEDSAKFGDELHRLIEGKQLVEQMLIYLRYHAKTLPEKTKG